MMLIKPASRLCSAVLIALGLSGALAAQGALAQEETSPPQLRKLCAEDYKKLCSGVQPGGGRIRECMVSNVDKLSPECRAGVEEWKKSKEEKKS